MPATAIGLVDWTLALNEDGHRDYMAKWLVKTDDVEEGPTTAWLASGLASVGSTWSFGIENDTWAFCWPNWRVAPAYDSEIQNSWYVEQPFSTRPMKRCNTTQIEDPLSEPIDLRGSFLTYRKQAQFDRFGNAILSSSWEPIVGPQTEVDDSRPQVICSFNVSSLPLSGYAALMHNVNDSTMWGLAPRCIKLSGVSWTRKLYGTCSYYYTIEYTLDINYLTFDNDVVDEGSRVLLPGGDPSNSFHFARFRDRTGDYGRCLLDGAGNAVDGTVVVPAHRSLEYYRESNLLLLGIPSSL
jgi:hypothetical protein